MTPSTPQPVLLAWSGGKDSALALAALQANPDYEVAALLTTFSEEARQTQMHRVPAAMIQAQANALDLPLHSVTVPLDPANTTYESRMQAALEHFQGQGVNACAFGDLFLEDIRAYREQNLARIGMQALFPLWALDTPTLARRFIAEGFKAIVVCVDTRHLPASLAGHPYDEAFLEALPPGVDPCGENGEFHSFVHDGPNFRQPVAFEPGASHAQGDFCWFSLQPSTS
jgi:uncharacterized protein (TIGR00290 family)